MPIEEFFRQENPDEKVLEQLRSLGCKEFGVETDAELDEFIENEIPLFKLVRGTGRATIASFRSVIAVRDDSDMN